MPNSESIQAYSKTGRVYFGYINKEESQDVIMESDFDLLQYKISEKASALDSK